MLYTGIDIGKSSHYAGFLSKDLLSRHKRFERCPALAFENSRAGFGALLRAIREHATLNKCIALIERTGHYGNNLIEFLLENGVTVYSVAVSERKTGMRKTDKSDALHLANIAYTQIGLGVQVADKTQQARRIVARSETAQRLNDMHRRSEMMQRQTATRNRLTAISDELFPEFATIFKDVNKRGALAVRERFPLPSDIAGAQLGDLVACREGTRPGMLGFAQLQELARETIGTRHPFRQASLAAEQALLITELRTIEQDLDVFDANVAQIIKGSREGKILTSLPMISTTAAAIIIHAIGSIGNFERAAELKSYFGWSPRVAQSGDTLDSVALTRGGNKPAKQLIYLVALAAIGHNTEWRDQYQALVPRMCRYDERQEKWRGKNKVVGRIAGQITEMIFVLLRKDFDILARLKPGEVAPEPTLYNREFHHAHRMHREKA